MRGPTGILRARATAFVEQADGALADLGRAEEVWQSFPTTRRDEQRLHVLSAELDAAIRDVEGRFLSWNDLDPAQVPAVSGSDCIYLTWMLSAHPSGYIREAFVSDAARFHNDQILPHLTNRALDFVPAIRELSIPIVMDRLDAILLERTGPGDHGVLPSSAHIAASKLLTPRTAVRSPELLQKSLELAETAPEKHKPGSFNHHKLQRMVERCQQTQASSSDSTTRQALDDLIHYFTVNAKPE